MGSKIVVATCPSLVLMLQFWIITIFNCSYMEMFLNMKEPLTSLKQAVLLDYYVSGFWWAKALEFTPVQLGGLLTLLNMLMNNIESKFCCILHFGFPV